METLITFFCIVFSFGLLLEGYSYIERDYPVQQISHIIIIVDVIAFIVIALVILIIESSCLQLLFG